jgi:hypothetical protein
LEELRKRIKKDQRNKNTDRIEAARKGSEEFQPEDYEELSNLQIISYDFGIS